MNLVKKKCGRCQTEKNIEEFYKQKDHKDGYASHCKKCDYERKKEYNQRPEVIEKRRALQRRWSKTPEGRRKRKAQKKKMKLKQRSNDLYVVTCPFGYYYIGSTEAGIKARLKKHFNAARNPRKSGTSLSKYMAENGLDRQDMTWKVIEVFENVEDLRKAENDLIKEHKDDPFLLNKMWYYETEEERREAHRERARERYKNRCKNDPEYRKAQSKRLKRYFEKLRKENPEKLREMNRKKSARRKERIQSALATPEEERTPDQIKAIESYERRKETARARYVPRQPRNPIFEADGQLKKKCIKCAEIKNLEKFPFYYGSHSKTGTKKRGNVCGTCKYKQKKAWRQKNSDKTKQWNKKYYQEKKAAGYYKDYFKKYYHSNKAIIVYKGICPDGKYILAATTMQIGQAKGNYFKMKNGKPVGNFARHIKENGYTRKEVVFTVLEEYETPEEMKADLKILLEKHSGDPLMIKRGR